jgi:hypothetical protein
MWLVCLYALDFFPIKCDLLYKSFAKFIHVTFLFIFKGPNQNFKLKISSNGFLI